jgi:hypothetical protein
MNKLFSYFRLLAVIGISSAFCSCSKTPVSDYLKKGFLNPPDSARPGVYWYFMDGNLDREAMTADLESMKNAGIGYVLFLEVNVGVPRGKTDFLSDEWQELFTHAVRECERLGIRLILGSGPGWAGSGGPWVNPSQSMIHLVADDTMVRGPLIFKNKLKVPDPKKPFFGEGSLTPELRQLRNDWYEDEFVLAFPTPENPAKIRNIDEKALYYRAPYTSQPGVLPFLKEDSENESSHSAIDRNKIIDITDHLQKDGMLVWDVPPGRWTIMRFGKRNNGAVTRPAPRPGLGFECDKFDTASFDAHYNAFIGKLIKKVSPVKSKSGGGWTMIHIDSWEMGAQNWSPHFREEFIKRRGYDPLPFLPVYSGAVVDNTGISERFLWDVRQTSNELIAEKHAMRFKELGRRNGFRLSIEPYDMNPSADLDLGSVADVPMCEFWSDGYGFNSSFSCFESASIAHLTGAPVVAAESFTADSREAWKKFPGNMKNQGDWAFSIGINRLIYHTFAHKPYGDQLRPGVTMGPYGVHWDRGQIWWPLASGYHRYITRCQYILSQGKPVADILYLTPEGAPQVFLPPHSAVEGTSVMPDKKGYSFDGCSPAYFIKYASVIDNMIVFPGGASYKILVIPDVSTMTPELLIKIEELIKAGARVSGNPPERSPSLSGFPGCDDRVNELVNRLWGKGLISRFSLENKDDSLCLYPNFAETSKLLAELGCQFDFEASGNIRYTHRQLADRDIYFISNRNEQVVTDTCLFRNGSNHAELWDAITGNISPLPDIRMFEGRISVPVRLEPFQSFFIVFYHDAAQQKDTTGGIENFPVRKVVMTLGNPWSVEFDTAWGGPEKINFEALTDWTTRSEEGIKYYSGIASYSTDFTFADKPGSQIGTELYLDLGKVKNIAEVKLNGKNLGIVWCDPWEVRITGALKKGRNHLQIDVANLWINRLIGDESEPWDGVADGKWPEWLINGTKRPGKRYTFTTHRFYKLTDPLVESGLLGPVTIEILK